uniref:BRO1 domain-containing protein n=1 Tax=Salarias fasciatus TaxID=181472 RepID=A0A672HJR5_SALFA
MATFISVPLKKSSEVDLVKPLSKFVTATYPAGEEQTEYIRAVEELNKLRKNALGRPLDKHESSLEIVLRYYDQLCAVEPKFPFSENQLCLTFTWKDAFDKGSLFGGSVKLALASLGYEKTCVLFNAAALASQIASEQNLDNDEGLKTAAKYYQRSVQPHQDTVLSALNREPTMDISPETVGTLSLIMLAQAQEVFFLKATSDKMKDAVIQCQYKDNLPKSADLRHSSNQSPTTIKHQYTKKHFISPQHKQCMGESCLLHVHISVCCLTVTDTPESPYFRLFWILVSGILP